MNAMINGIFNPFEVHNEAKMVMLSKTGKPTIKKDKWRPIAVLSQMRKMAESSCISTFGFIKKLIGKR